MAKKTATKTTKVYLKRELTDEEVAKAANQLVQELDVLEQHNDGLVAVKAEFKARIEKSEAEIKIQQSLVRNRYEHCYIDCVEVFDFSNLTVTTTRKDTGDQIGKRSMTETEKQTTMEFDEK